MKYNVLQHINNAIFPDVDMLMGNIVAVTDHIRKKLAGTADIERRCLRFIPAKDGKYYHFDGDKYWRVMVFIPDTMSMSEVTPETSYIVGETFGQFQSWLADIPVELGETIKDFHNMEFRLWQLREAVKANKSGRLGEVQDLVDAIEARADEMTKGERLYREGKLPKRICHCDTKVDNILFEKNGDVLCVIDLDTVMPNFVFSDFGDYLRSAANTGKEIENLPYAAKLFPYMQTVRFLADYIAGDLYYKTQYPEHNLVRSRAQLKLFCEADRCEPQMKEFIASCC